MDDKDQIILLLKERVAELERALTPFVEVFDMCVEKHESLGCVFNDYWYRPEDDFINAAKVLRLTP